MKRIVKDADVNGLEALLGENVLLMCANYFYAGKLTGVNAGFVELENPSIVYETGDWKNKAYGDAQPLHAKKWYVQTQFIESYGASK